MKALAFYAMKGRTQAFFLAVFFALVPFLGWIGSALMGLVTLRNGAREGALLLLGLTLVDLLYFSVTNVSLYYLLYDTLANNVPTFLAALYMRRFASWNKLIEILTYLGLAIILIAHVVFPDLTQFWATHLLKLFQYLNTVSGAEVSNKMNLALANNAAHYATGLQAVLIICVILFNLIIARYMQASLYNPGGLKRELYALHMPKHVAFILIFISLLPWFHITVAKDLMPLAALPFLFSGTSLFYDFASKRPYFWAWLISFYALLLLALPYLCLLLIIVGLLDTFYHFRSYFRGIS